MELSLSHTLHLFNIFREYDGKDNCAQVLEEKIYKMFGTKYLNDEHDFNVVSTSSLNIHDANDMHLHERNEIDKIFFEKCPLLKHNLLIETLGGPPPPKGDPVFD